MRQTTLRCCYDVLLAGETVLQCSPLRNRDRDALTVEIYPHYHKRLHVRLFSSHRRRLDRIFLRTMLNFISFMRPATKSHRGPQSHTQQHPSYAIPSVPNKEAESKSAFVSMAYIRLITKHGREKHTEQFEGSKGDGRIQGNVKPSPAPGTGEATMLAFQTPRGNKVVQGWK